MKKSLLFAVAVCFAMGMNAQVIKHNSNITAIQQTSQFANVQYNAAAVKAQPAKLTVDVNARQAAHKANALKVSRPQGEMMGKYYEPFVEGDVTLSLPVNLETATTAEGETYVEISGLFRGFGQSVVGFYDAEAGTLTVPAEQYVGDFDYNGTPLCLVVYGCEDAGDGEHLNFLGDFNEDGSLGEGGLDDLVFNVVEEEGSTFLIMETGWCLMAYTSLDEDGENLGTLTYSFDGETLNQCNWGVSFYGSYLTGNSSNPWSEWERKQAPVYAELFDDSVVFYGFENQFTIEIGLDAATGSCTLPNQPVYVEGDKTFGVHVLVPNAEGKLVVTNGEAELPGVYMPENEYVGLYTRDEAGETTDDYFLLCTEYEEGVGAYMLGEYVAVEFCSMNSPVADQVIPDLVDGINTVLAPAATAKKGNFNLAGQRVNTYTKGINIENGKKVVR